MVTTERDTIRIDWTRFRDRFILKDHYYQYIQVPPKNDYIIWVSEADVMVYTEVGNTSPRNASQIDWEDNYLADANSEPQSKVAIWDGSNGNMFANVLDKDVHRLAVDNMPSRRPETVHELSGYNNDTTKTLYTVPSGKVLYVQGVWTSYDTDAGGHIVSFRVDGTQFQYGAVGDDSSRQFQRNYVESVPYGPIAAGSVVTAYREDGSSNESWVAGFEGYLEDA